MESSENTRAVVYNLLQRIGAGDPAKIAELYAEQVTWQLAWPQDEFDAVVPWIRHRSTRADVEDHYRTVADQHVSGQTSVELATVLVDGADAAVVGELAQTLRTTGTPYRTQFVLYLTVGDGQVTRHHIVEDNLAVRRAFDTAAPASA